MNKLLTRRVIIREYDFKKVSSFGFYNVTKFEPCLRSALEQEQIMRILQGKYSLPSDLTDPISLLLWDLRDRLYNRNYIHWNFNEDNKGYVWIWARSNTPKTVLGLATFQHRY